MRVIHSVWKWLEPRRTIRYLLLPISWIFGLILYIRHFLFDRRWLWPASFAVPTICVGNISVGGSGKTPFIHYLSHILAAHGYTVGILSRGYGRKSKGFAEVHQAASACDTGDEPLLHARYFPNAYVAVSEDRAIGITELMALHPDIEVMLLDDAYQHRWVKPHCNILLTDFRNPFYNDLLLPVGNNRDLVSAAQRADFLIFTRTPSTASDEAMSQATLIAKRYLKAGAHIYFTTMMPGIWQPVFDSQTMHLSEQGKAIAFAGVAHPATFFEGLQHFELIKKIEYPDHYLYQDADVWFLHSLLEEVGYEVVLLTTDKDAIRLRSLPLAEKLLKGRIYQRGIKISFLRDEKKFVEQITNHIHNVQFQTD